MTPAEKTEYLARVMPKLRQNGTIKRYDPDISANVERHYIRAAARPKSAVVQTKYINQNADLERITRGAKHTAAIKAILDRPMLTREVSELTGLTLHVVREVLNKGAGAGVFIKDESVHNKFRYSLA